MSQNRYWYLLAKKLSGEALSEELEELKMLMKDHPEWIYPSEHIRDLWYLSKKETEAQKQAYDAELAFELHLEKLKQSGTVFPELETPVTMEEIAVKKPASSRKKTILFFCFSFLIIIVSGFIWTSFNKPANILHSEKNISEVSTRPGSKTKLVLPDSTVVWLNSGSRLSYNEQFGITNRNTTLTGEAFFDVKKSTTPFIIHAGHIQIKVMGTAFNVKSYPNEKTTETSLIRGRVEISLDKRPGEKFILKPNEKLVVANELTETKSQMPQKKEPLVALGYLTRTPDSTIVETSWVDNKMVFQDEAFDEVAKKMERWYDVNILFKDDKLRNQRLSGTFTKETVQEALEALQMTTHFHFTFKRNLITINE